MIYRHKFVSYVGRVYEIIRRIYSSRKKQSVHLFLENTQVYKNILETFNIRANAHI